MKSLLNSLLIAARSYTIFDYGVLKLTLVCVGILLGIYFGSFFALYLRAVWLLAIVGFVYLIYSTLTKLERKN